MLGGFSLDPLYRVVGWLLAVFYSVPPHNLGIAIIVLTIVVMAVQFPLIQKQTRSMIQMQRVQPELKKIQQKYKDDRAKQNEELLKFYQENKINPLAGCLPILITLPIGIAVFRTFRNGVQKHLPQSGPFSSLYKDICSVGGKTLDVNQCGKALSTATKNARTPPTFRFLGMNLNWSAHQVQSVLSGEYLRWTPYFLLIALVVVTGWYQVRQTQARQTRQGSAAPNAQMQAITRIMPIFFGFITYGLNAATTIYFLVSNVWRIGQQHFVLNKMYEEDHPKTALKAPAPEPDPPPNGEGGGAGKSNKNAGAEPAKSTTPNRRKQRKRKR